MSVKGNRSCLCLYDIPMDFRTAPAVCYYVAILFMSFGIPAPKTFNYFTFQSFAFQRN
jgi:hypothetical protein